MRGLVHACLLIKPWSTAQATEACPTPGACRVGTLRPGAGCDPYDDAEGPSRLKEAYERLIARACTMQPGESIGLCFDRDFGGHGVHGNKAAWHPCVGGFSVACGRCRLSTGEV